MATKIKNPNEVCCMCGKSKNQVLHLMQGVYGYVCDQCIEEGHEMLSEYAEHHQCDAGIRCGCNPSGIWIPFREQPVCPVVRAV